MTEENQHGFGAILERSSHCPVTATTVATSVIATIAFWNGYEVDSLFMNGEAVGTEPWRLITSTLLHGGFIHLLFNVIMAWRFGCPIEERYGSARTIALYLALAAGSSAAEFALFRGGIGLSGVVYGMFGFLWVVRRREPRFASVVDRRLTNLLVGWFFLCILLTWMEVWSIANVAHGAGAGLGFLIGRAVISRPGQRLAWRGAVATALVAIGLLASVARPLVNFGSGATDDLWDQAQEAFARDDWGAAIELFGQLIDRGGNPSLALSNIGAALSNDGRLEESLEKLNAAIEADPYNAHARYTRGSVLSKLGESDRALDDLEHAGEIEPHSARPHYLRARTYFGLGRFEDALDACDAALARSPGDEDSTQLRAQTIEKLGGR